MPRVELFGGPLDGEEVIMDGTPTMPMVLWINETDLTYGWDGEGEFKLTYTGERKR